MSMFDYDARTITPPVVLVGNRALSSDTRFARTDLDAFAAEASSFVQMTATQLTDPLATAMLQQFSDRVPVTRSSRLGLPPPDNAPRPSTHDARRRGTR